MNYSTKMRFILISVIFTYTTLTTSASETNSIFSVHENYYYLNDSTDLVRKVFKKGYSTNTIISIPKGNRPNPSNYLKWRYRHRHQRKFRRGASFLIPKYIIDKYGKAVLGRQDGLFVMCKEEMDDLIQKANGQLSYIETELGIPLGMWKDTEIIRIDIRRPKRFHLRIPSGNEVGANALWIPGGKLPNGYLESVINPVTEGKYTQTPIILR